MMKDQRDDRVHLPQGLEHRGSHFHVVANLADLFFGELAFPVEQLVGNPDLADIVQHRGEIELVFLLRRETEFLADEERVAADSRGVTTRVLVPCLDCADERFNGVVEEIPEIVVQPRVVETRPALSAIAASRARSPVV